MPRLIKIYGIIFGLGLLMLAACDRNYKCVCMSAAKGKDTLVDQVKTTKLGSKGYKKTCTDYENENADLHECHLE